MSFVRDIADKMIYVRLFLLLFIVLLEDKRLRPAETVMQLPNGFGIAES